MKYLWTTPILALFLFCVVSSKPNVAAAENEARGIRQARAYAKTHGFEVRIVEAGPANRRVKRAFVPVTEKTYNSFFSHFNGEKGYLAVRHTTDNTHVAANLKVEADGKPADCYLWGLNYNGDRTLPNNFRTNDCRSMYMTPNHPGEIMVCDLKGSKLDHLVGWLDHNEQTGNRLHPENCMMWLGNAEIGPGKLLFTDGLGVRRAKTAIQVASKMKHAANELVSVVGVMVDPEQHKQMTDEQLLGPVPDKGVDNAVARPAN